MRTRYDAHCGEGDARSETRPQSLLASMASVASEPNTEQEATAPLHSEAEYLAARAKENYPTISRVLEVVFALVCVLGVLLVVLFDNVAFAVAFTLPLGVAVAVLRFTEFGKTHVETFAATVATLLLLVLALFAHTRYSNAEANNELCVSLNTTVSFRNGTSEGSFDVIDGMTGDYCQDLVNVVGGWGGRAGDKFISHFSIWLVFTQVSLSTAH